MRRAKSRYRNECQHSRGERRRPCAGHLPGTGPGTGPGRCPGRADEGADYREPGAATATISRRSAGANARHSIGTGIIGGMIGETTLAMLYVPLLFYLFDQLAEGKDTPPAAPVAAAAGEGAISTPQATSDGH